MRAILLLTAIATAAVLASGAAPGQPKGAAPPTKPATLKKAAAEFAKAVFDQVGKDAELRYAAKIAPSGCRGSHKPTNQIFDALTESVKAIDWVEKELKLAPDEQLLVVIEEPKTGRTFRFAVALGERDHPNDPARTEPFLRCTSPALTVIYEVTEQLEVADVVNVSVTNTVKNGLIIQALPEPDLKLLKTRIAVPKFGAIKIHKREGKDGTAARPLPFELRKLDLTPTVPGWRYRCPELTAETTFEVGILNDQPHAWAIEVELDGRSSTAAAGGRFAGAKYIIPGTPKGEKPDEYFIKGWLKEPKGKANAAGVVPFEYTEFLVKNVPDSDPALGKITAESRSTIRVAWYGAWPSGTPRPKDLPSPQGAADIVGQGKHGTQELKVVEYDTDKLPQGSVVIEFGGRAKKD